jgi:hypothetical protein
MIMDDGGVVDRVGMELGVMAFLFCSITTYPTGISPSSSALVACMDGCGVMN